MNQTPLLTADASTASKKDAGATASSGSECKSGFAELWSNEGSNAVKRCCPVDNVKLISGVTWCSSLANASACTHDEQCESGTCGPGTDRICVARANADAALPNKKSGDVVSTGSECTIGFAALWNNEGTNSAKRCCPSVNVKSINGLSWCTFLPDASMCIHNEQCDSGVCSPGETSDSVCVPRPGAKKVGESCTNNEECSPGFCKLQGGEVKTCAEIGKYGDVCENDFWCKSKRCGPMGIGKPPKRRCTFG